MRGRDFLSPAKRSTALASRYGGKNSPRRAHRKVAYSGEPIHFQFAAYGRGMGRANAPSRRNDPVTIRLAKAETIPPSSTGRADQIENIVTDSSPFSPSLQHACNPSAGGLRPVTPILPVAPYIGGKRKLAKRVIARIDAVEHHGYAEVFVGMGGIFLRRGRRPSVEVINDWSQDIATFFRVLQHHYVAFLDMIRFQISSRANFERLLALEPDSLTDLQRAARFLYVQRLAFGGRVAGRTFGVASSHSGRFDVAKLGPMLEALHERLSGVTIERLRWQDFLARYDRAGMLFYLDPPYHGGEGDYGKGMFAREDFEELAARLAALKGRFIMSINDTPDIRRIFAAFHLEQVETTYSVGGGARVKPARELLVSGRV